MIGDIQRIDAFTIEQTTYHYLVEGICYAESPLSAERGLEAYLALPPDCQAFLRHEVKLDLIILIQDSDTLNAENRVGHWKVAVGTQEAMIRLASGGKSIEVLASKLTHELDHHFRFRTGELTEAMHKADGMPIPNSLGHNSTDPAYLTKSRKQFQQHFFQDMVDHMQANQIASIHQIENPIACLLFKKPMLEYFYPAIKAGIKQHMLKNGVSHSTDYTLIATQAAEQHWLRGEKPLTVLVAKLKQLYPALSLKAIREIVSSASLTTRIEIAAHHAEASQLNPALTKKTSPRLSEWLSTITEQRRLLMTQASEPPQPSSIQVPVFDNVRMNDIHNPLPDIDYVTMNEVRQMGYGHKPVCLKYVILETGELRLAKSFSKLTPLTARQAEAYKMAELRIQGFKLINDQPHPFSTMYNGDIIYFDTKGINPAYIKIPVKHPEVAGLQPVIAAGDAYVTNGRFCPPKKINYRMSGGIDNWTGHYLVNGRHLKAVVEGTFRVNGYLEAKGCYYNRAEDVGRTKTLIIPKIIRSVYTVKNPYVNASITIDMTSPNTNFTKIAKGLLPKGLLGLNMVANVAEFGDVPAGVMATAAEIGTMRALQVLAPLPLLPLTILGSLPDVQSTFDEVIANQDAAPEERVLTEAEKLNNLLVWGNPWGPDRGLTSASMTAMQKASVVLRTDPEPFVGALHQKVGQGINKVVKQMGVVTASVVTLLNPLSCVNKLDAPSHYRPENHPGYAFIDALKATESKSQYQPNLVQVTFQREIETILAPRTPLPTLVNLIDPMQLQREATYALGYVGPKFHFTETKFTQWVKGAGVAGSLLTVQLTWASCGAAIALVSMGEALGRLMHKREISKQKRRSRNSRRVNEQCHVIELDINKAAKKVDEAITLVNRYLTENDPTAQKILYEQCRQAVADAKTENDAQIALNVRRISDKDTHVDGHKIRLRARRYCEDQQEVLVENTTLLSELVTCLSEAANRYEDLEKHRMITLTMEKIEAAMSADDYALAEKHCMESTLSAALKSQTLNDIHLEKDKFQRQQISQKLSIGVDAANLTKNVLTLFVMARPAPIISIPMTKADDIVPPNLGLWQQQSVTKRNQDEKKRSSVEKLPTVVSGQGRGARRPVSKLKI